jgi:hypothetical protein
MPWFAAAAALVSAGIGTYAAVAQGEAAEDASHAQQKAANQQASSTQAAASLEAAQVRRENLLRLGTQRASTAKSGVLIDGSAGDTIYDSAIQGELEALSVLYSGASEAGYHRSRGKIARMEGKAAKQAGYVSGAGTLIGGAGSAYAKAPSFKKT